MPGTAVTKSVVATEPGGKKREEIFVDIIERISVTFSSSVSTDIPCHSATFFSFSNISNVFCLISYFLYKLHGVYIVCSLNLWLLILQMVRRPWKFSF